MKKSVGVLLLRDTHHVYHLAPIAFALSTDHDYEVCIYTSYTPVSNLVKELAHYYPNQRCQIIELNTHWLKRWFNFRKKKYPRPKDVLRYNADVLAHHDACLCADYFGLHLRNNPHFKGKIIKSAHGAGSRAYAYKQELAEFDYLLLPGQQFAQQLAQRGILRATQSAVIGYPKFEIAEQAQRNQAALFANKQPVVLYNPHFKTELSSWPDWGWAVLDFFQQHPTYNLIFAPHIDLNAHLSQQQLARIASYAQAPNIHIDMGSMACIDMSYTLAADIYLGDVSSQVYEFLIRPRACLFLNPHGLDTNTDANCLTWKLGTVVDDMTMFASALQQAVDEPHTFTEVQHHTMADVISITTTPASQRAATAIKHYLDSQITH